MKFSILFATALIGAVSAQSAPADAAAPAPDAAAAAPAAPDPKCAAAVQACTTPTDTCVSNMCSACSTALPCCAQPAASQLSCFQSQAAAFASATAAAPAMPSITDTAQLTGTVACAFAGVIGMACQAATTSFTALPTPSQASCLCYQNVASSSAVWAPSFFDAAVSNCAGFLASAGSTAEAAQNSAVIGLCSKAGNIRTLPTLTATGGAPAATSGAAETGTAAGSGVAEPSPTTEPVKKSSATRIGVTLLGVVFGMGCLAVAL